MSQLPLHPAIVHFPIVLSFLVPVVAVVVAWAIFTGRLQQRSWLIPVSLQVAVFLSAWLAVQLGEEDEELVEAIVTEQALEEHEELGEAFLVCAGGLMLLMISPFLIRTRFLPPILAVLSLLGTVMVIQVGRSGGDLVYSHGAAMAFSTTTGQTSRSSRMHDDDDDDDDHDDDD